jgi:hypothetical protein
MPLDNFEAARELLGNRARRKLENNTYLLRLGPHVWVIRLHSTNVVTYFDDGRIILNNGGWDTKVTRDRMSSYSPARITRYRSTTYVQANHWRFARPFENGVDVGPSRSNAPEGLPAPLNKTLQGLSRLSEIEKEVERK